MKTDMDIDAMLRHALSPKDKPSVSVNGQLLSKLEEDNAMKKRIFVKSPVAAALTAAAILAVGGVSAYAAWKYLTPSEVAEVVKDHGLAKAFDSKDAVIINRTVSDYGFDVTLLGMVSGKELSSLPLQQVEFTTIAGQQSGAQDRIKKDSTYCVIAIQYSGKEERDKGVISDKRRFDDGAGVNAGFCVSPFIQGQKPWECNIWSMSGGVSSYEEDGVYYQIVQCDDLEAFADRTIYLGVTDAGNLMDGSVYGYNENTGEISSREGWPGLNVLFTLPFDGKRADERQAEKLLQQWKEDAGIGTEENQYVFRHDEWEMKRETAWTAEDVLERGKAVKGTKQIVSVDSDGFTEDIEEWEYRGVKALAGAFGITSSFYDSDGNSVENSWKDSDEESRKYYANLSVKKGTTVIVSAAAFKKTAGNSVEEFKLFQTLTWNGDGTVTYCAYYV